MLNFVRILFAVIPATVFASAREDCTPFDPQWWGDDQVAVVHCNKDGRFVVTYDVREMNLVNVYTYDAEKSGDVAELKVIQPFVDVLKDQLLHGHTFKGLTRPQVCGAKFSLSDVDLGACTKKVFVSSIIDACAFRAYDPLQALGRVHTPANEAPLIFKNMRFFKSLSFRTLSTEMRWDVVTSEDMHHVMQQKHYDMPDTYVVLRDHYAFCGVVCRTCGKPWAQTIPQENVLHYKLSQAADEMKRVYPFTEEKAQCCLNYQGGRIVWP